MGTIARRLALVRKSLGLSLRRTAQLLEEAGYPVSHDAVHKYERGRKVPADYVRAFCQAFGCRARWVLSGSGSPLDGSWDPESVGAPAPWREDAAALPHDLLAATHREYTSSVRRAWKRFLESGRGDDDALRPLILRSWDRSRDAGIEPEGAGEGPPADPPRLSPEEVERRRDRCRALLDAAARDLEWLASLHRDLDHVVYLVCPDGIVLESRGEPPELRERWSLLPGHDWSEEAMGTSGAGTALATGRPVAVVGPEHYVESFHGCACVAAPVVDPDSRVVGAIDLTTTLEASDPRRLAVVAYAAETVSEKLKGGPS